MSVPPPAERGRDIGRLVKKGARTTLLIGMGVRAAAGMVEAGPSPAQAANQGADRSGISAPIYGHGINTLGKPDDGGKSIAKSKGKTSSVSTSPITSSIPPNIIEGKFISDNYHPDIGDSNGVFKNTRGGKNIGPASQNIFEFNQTAGRDWSAQPRNNLNKPKTQAKVDLPPLFDQPPEWVTSLENNGIQILASFLDGGPILAACAPIPNITPTRESQSGPTPTVVRDAQFGDAKVEARLISDVTLKDDKTRFEQFVTNVKRLAITQFGPDANNLIVTVPINENFLNLLRTETPNFLVTNKVTSDAYMLAFGGRDARFVKMPSNGIWAESSVDNVLQPTVVVASSKDPTGALIAKTIYAPKSGMFYDATNLPDIAPGVSELNQKLETAFIQKAKEIYQTYDDKAHPGLVLYRIPSIGKDGTSNLTLKAVKKDGSVMYWQNNDKGEFVQAKANPGKRFDKLDNNGQLLEEVEGKGTDAGEWYLTGGIFDANQNATIQPTSTPTVTPSPSPTAEATKTPTATATPDYPAEWATPPDGAVHFSSDMVNLDRGKFPPNVDKKLGANFETGDFPGFGKGLFAYSSGNPVSEGTRIIRRGYPTFYPWGFTDGLEGAHSLSMTVLVDDEGLAKTDSGFLGRPHEWLSVLSLYGWRDGAKDKGAEAVATVNIIPDGKGGYVAALYSIIPDTTNPIQARIVNNAPKFEFGKKYRFEIVVGNDRSVRLYQTDSSSNEGDPKLVAVGKISDKLAIGIRGGHGGVYGGKNAIKLYNADVEIKKLK